MTTVAAKTRYATARGEPARYLREVALPHDGEAMCLIWPYARHERGYGIVRHKGRAQWAHRVVCELVHGPAPTPKHEAAHSCGHGDWGCINPHHLSWKTHAGNEADKLLHGTSNRGESHGLAKLTDIKAREILHLKGKMLQREIAAKFGVSKQNVQKIHARETWAWL